MDRTTPLFGKVQMFVLLEVEARFGAKSADFYKQTDRYLQEDGRQNIFEPTSRRLEL